MKTIKLTNSITEKETSINIHELYNMLVNIREKREDLFDKIVSDVVKNRQTIVDQSRGATIFIDMHQIFIDDNTKAYVGDVFDVLTSGFDVIEILFKENDDVIIDIFKNDDVFLVD